ncbi:MAG: glycosyltransferase [Oscillospiraceae bacterium]|nr:glycosyltransferase [Oscillospiraceae bacterium]
MKRLGRAVRKYGIIGIMIKVMKKIAYRIFAKLDNIDKKLVLKREPKIRKANKGRYDFLENLCKNNKYKSVFVFYPYTEWDLPIFQRPQQIALELSKRGDVLYLYCTANHEYDNVDIYEEINENLYLTTEYDFIKNLDLDNRIIHLYSTDIVSETEEIEQALNREDKVLYEYIDEIHEDITQALPKSFMQKHNYIINNPDCYIVTTADKLHEDIVAIRKDRVVLSTNGVHIEDFIYDENIAKPGIIEELEGKYDKIIGYYGALAKWFDYEAVKKSAEKHPNYAFILIGIEYDGSLKKSKLLECKNVYYIGKVKYNELISYSANMDLLTIPFLINDITESTSPVKLFEYMATGKPILTTDMRECRKYKSVKIAKDHEEFASMIPEVIELINDREYRELLIQEAKENTWSKKADSILELLRK